MGIGDFAALGAAGLWAVSSLIYGRTRLSAWSLNLAKNMIASSILIVHLSLRHWFSGGGVLELTMVAGGWLALSGFFGIVLGDTFYFRSLQILGPRRALIVVTSAPLFSALLGWFWLGEVIPAWGIFGIAITLLGICIVIVDRRAALEAPGLYPGTLAAGLLYGTLGALCQSVGIAIAKIGMADCDPLTATFVRLVTAGLGALVLVAASGRLRRTLSQILQRATLKKLIPGAMLGTWLGIWFSQIAIKNSDIAVATTLMITSPLFAIPLVRMVFGYRITARSIVGTLVAVGGIALIVHAQSAAHVGT